MAPKGCPIRYPYKCKHCPIPPWERVKVCAIYRGQIIAGVPWHWGADRRWFGRLPRGIQHPLLHEAIRIEFMKKLKKSRS